MRCNVIFVTDSNAIATGIPGGVQVCTAEYLSVLRSAGFDPKMVPVRTTRSLWVRLLIKLGLEAYARYDFKGMAREVAACLSSKSENRVVVNQVYLLPLIRELKAIGHVPFRSIVLSHGNESGDFLHDIQRRDSRLHGASLVEIFRLGLFLLKESTMFKRDADVVVCLTEIECKINTWLGAKKVCMLPRAFVPEMLSWRPVLGRVGFVGTLSHGPNYQGLLLLLDEMAKNNTLGMDVRLVGGPEAVGLHLQSRYSFLTYLGRLEDAELRKEAETWSLFVNPVFWSSRGASTKLAMGINWGLPIVSTVAGNRGYIWSDGNIATVSTPDEMAQVIASHAFDLGLLHEMSQQTGRVSRSGPLPHDLAEVMKQTLA